MIKLPDTIYYKLSVAMSHEIECIYSKIEGQKAEGFSIFTSVHSL